MFFRYAGGLREFLQSPLAPAECRNIVEASCREREQSFLQILRRSIFGFDKSPYLALLRWARIDFGDIERMTKRDGVEPALKAMCEAGVYTTIEEVKGRRPVCRPGLELPVDPTSFDNPLLPAHFQALTGGSSGVRRRLNIDLDALVYDAACHSIFLDAFGLAGSPYGIWRPVPPNASGVSKALHHLKTGRPVARWFSQTPLRYGAGQWKYAAFTRYTAVATFLAGKALPTPAYTPLNEARQVARWLRRMKDAGEPAHLDCGASAAVRACLAARDEGLDISGTFMRLGGEPLTPGKAKVFGESGVRARCHFSMGEAAGHVGVACADPQALDDVHLLEGKIAFLQRPRLTPRGEAVNALYLTTLLPSAPKIMLNTECGDYGMVERRLCNCPFGQLGLETHLHTIRSFEKLTSEGMTFLGSDVFTLLEEILPSKHGGHASDYQLLEEEAGGIPSVSILVSPRVGPVDEAAVVETAMQFLARRDDGHRLMAEIWKDARTLRVQRREPIATPASKVLPLQTSRD